MTHAPYQTHTLTDAFAELQALRDDEPYHTLSQACNQNANNCLLFQPLTDIAIMSNVLTDASSPSDTPTPTIRFSH